MVTVDITLCFTKSGKGDKGYNTTHIEKKKTVVVIGGGCSSIKIHDST